MKSVKFLLVIAILAVMALFSFGCAESFSYTYAIDGDGVVYMDYLLLYDADSEDASLVKSRAVTAMNNYVEANALEEYATMMTDVEGEVRLELTFPSVTEYYIALGYTGREANEPDEPAKVGLINRYDALRSGYLSEENLEYVRSLIGDESVELTPDACDFYYTYGTFSKLTTSNGEVEKKDGMYYHTWKLRYGEDPNIVIRNYSLNGVIFFSIIISIFILSLATIFVIITINRKKEGKLRLVGADGRAAANEDDAASAE